MRLAIRPRQSAPFRMQQPMFSQQDYPSSQRNQNFLVESMYSTPFRSIASQAASPHVMSTPVSGRSIYQNAAQQRIEGQPRVSGIYPPSHLAGFSDFDFSQQQFPSSSNVNDFQESPFSQTPMLNESPLASSQRICEPPTIIPVDADRAKSHTDSQKLNDPPPLPDLTQHLSTRENTQTSQATLVAPVQENSLPTATAATDTATATTTLKGASGQLFGLSQVDLEKTVAHLIRDESFLQLVSSFVRHCSQCLTAFPPTKLEKLDQSWRIKAMV